MSSGLPSINVPVRDASVPAAEAGWYLTWGYGIRPLVLYASKGQTVWRDGARRIPITHHAGPIPERK